MLPMRDRACLPKRGSPASAAVTTEQGVEGVSKPWATPELEKLGKGCPKERGN